MNLEQYRDKDLSILTPCQKEIFILALSGKSQNEIAEMRGCVRQSISNSLKRSCLKLDGGKAKKPKKAKCDFQRGRIVYDRSKYKDADYSVLTEREARVFKLWINGMTYREIAKELGCSTGNVGNTIESCRKKTSGEKTYAQIWYEKNKERVSEKIRTDPKRAEYRRKYYQENKERILEKQKERKKEGLN